MTIGFLGINSKSLSFSILFEKNGHECFFYDSDENLVFNLNQKIFISDEIEIQQELVDRKKISASTEVTEVIKTCDTIFSFIDCPINSNNTFDTTEVFEIVQQFYLASHVDINLYDKNFILSSVLNVGDSKKINEKISQFGIKFGYLPNFLTQDNSIKSLQTNTLYILGTQSHELSVQISDLLRTIQKNSNIYIMSFESAELSKLAVSAIVGHKIVISNLIGDMMKTMDLDREIPMVLKSISDDPRIGKQHMTYGLGYGGPNLGKEIKVLSEFVKNKKVRVDIFNSTEEANNEHMEFMKYYYMSINPNKETPFVIDSLGYKKNSKVLEDSPRFRLCIELLQEGYIINIIENLEISMRFKELSESFSGRLKFFVKGSKPEGVKINL